MKFGRAMAARMPIMITTTSSSIRVKPPILRDLFLVLTIFLPLTNSEDITLVLRPTDSERIIRPNHLENCPLGHLHCSESHGLPLCLTVPISLDKITARHNPRIVQDQLQKYWRTCSGQHQSQRNSPAMTH